MPRRATDPSLPERISLDESVLVKHAARDRDELVNWSSAYPPVLFREVPCDYARKEIEHYVSQGSFWDNNQVVDWAINSDLPESAMTLSRCRFNGQQLLKSDAVKLQNFGVTNGVEAINAQEKIKYLSKHLERSMAEPNRRAVYNYKELVSGVNSCPCHSVLSTLSTDPWVDNTHRILPLPMNDPYESSSSTQRVNAKKPYEFRLFPTF